MKILALLFALTLPAQAVLIGNSISGDMDSLHAEFSFDWGATGGGGEMSGAWEGGIYIYSGGIVILHSGSRLEMRQSFFLRTFWNDGWEPGALSIFQPAEIRPVYGFPLSVNLPPDSPYSLSAFALLETTVNSDRSGFGTITYDISRTPVAFRDSGPFLPQQSVPEGGSTLLLFSPVLLLLLWRGRATPHKTVQKC